MTVAKIKEHALACYPKEMCGIIVGDEFIPLTNSAKEPEKEFKVAAELLIPYLGKIKSKDRLHLIFA